MPDDIVSNSLPLFVDVDVDVGLVVVVVVVIAPWRCCDCCLSSHFAFTLPPFLFSSPFLTRRFYSVSHWKPMLYRYSPVSSRTGIIVKKLTNR